MKAFYSLPGYWQCYQESRIASIGLHKDPSSIKNKESDDVLKKRKPSILESQLQYCGGKC